MDETFAENFAQDWISAWNAHDLDQVLEHYAEDVEFYSPFVTNVLGEPSGKVSGKDALRSYFGRALQAYPSLHFELYTVLTGVESVTLHYQSVKGLIAAEVMLFNRNREVAKVFAHYSQP
jgi:hypothetical protein